MQSFFSPTVGFFLSLLRRTVDTLTNTKMLPRLCDATDGQRTESFGSYIGFKRGFKISEWLRYDLRKEKKHDRLSTVALLHSGMEISETELASKQCGAGSIPGLGAKFQFDLDNVPN